MGRTALAKTQGQAPTLLLAKIAARYSVDETKLLATLKQTAFRQKDDKTVSDEQMTALLIVADQYGLNPFTKEIFAYPDKNNGIVPVVGVDGWSRIINEHPQLDGIEFVYSEETKTHKGKTVHDWIECRISRKDRAKPIVVREFFDEVVRTPNFTTPWDSHPNRMHRHKTLIQCSRVAFGFVGIYDEDEAARIVEAEVVDRKPLAEGDAGHQVEPKAKQPAEKPAYPDDQFNENLPKWENLVKVGTPSKDDPKVMIKKTPKDILKMVESKYTLSNEQHSRISNIGEQQ